ncbi:cytochrome c1 [Legionella sp. CNM-1927-20]|uniref:cytochrome c1 n=1 Tax=Legionella sp. CNM-1927-20 TaxID=3422221 RepID=UPI00403B25F8
MKQFIVLLVSLTIATVSYALENEDVPMLPVEIDLHDQAGLQRGAKLFMNYCSGCHSLKFMRYNQMANDLGLTTFDGEVDKDLLFNNLVFTHAKLHDPIEIALPAVDAKQWFGTVPPDLSLIARVRGPSWLYTFLKSFYADPSRPFGSNNLLIPGVAMPNVLAPLAGQVIAVRKNNQKTGPIDYLLKISDGEMTTHEFDNAVEDLVNFLTYVGEPVQLTRYRIGVFIIAFLSIFLIVVYLLKRSYWQRLPH